MNPRTELILSTAGTMFNQEGFSSFSLAGLASRLNLSRATLYNHIGNRENLIYQCFTRSVEADACRLKAAAREKGGLNQILQYIRECFSEAAQEQVTIIDTAVLSKEPRAKIDKLIRNNYDTLQELLDAGVKEGSIRACDTRLLSRAIPSITTFARTSNRWIKDRRTNNPDAVTDFIQFGTSADRSHVFEFSESVDSFSRLSAAGFGKQKMADMRIEQILMTGSTLMNRLGMENVSLELVAEALDATRGSVYHYLQNREDLISQCLKRGFDLYDQFIEYADFHGRTGLEKSSIVSHLNTQAQAGELQPALAWMSFELPSKKLSKQLISRMRGMTQRVDAFYEQGIKDGTRRDLDVEVVSVVRAGAYLWIPKWIDQLENQNQQHIADEIVGLINKGLAPL